MSEILTDEEITAIRKDTEFPDQLDAITVCDFAEDVAKKVAKAQLAKLQSVDMGTVREDIATVIPSPCRECSCVDKFQRCLNKNPDDKPCDGRYEYVDQILSLIWPLLAQARKEGRKEGRQELEQRIFIVAAKSDLTAKSYFAGLLMQLKQLEGGTKC